MDPTNPGSGSDVAWTSTRLTRHAANAAAAAAVAFWALFIFSAQLPGVRAHSPWTEDPYDAVVSFAALLVPFVALLTFVRCQRWRGPAAMPASAVRQVLRGVSVALLAIGATVVADMAALVARARVEAWGPWFGSLVGLLALTGVLTLGAAALLALAWWSSRCYLAGEAANPAREDDSLESREKLWFPDFIWKWTTGYGQRMHRLLLIFLFFAVLGTVVFSSASSLTLPPGTKGSLETQQLGVRVVDRAIYSVDLLLPLLDLRTGDIRIPDYAWKDTKNWEELMKYWEEVMKSYEVVHIFIGWLLIGLLLAWITAVARGGR